MDRPYCPHFDGTCQIASAIAQHEAIPAPIDCCACLRFDSRHNDVTKHLAKLADPSLLPENEGPGTGLTTLFSWFIPKPPNCACGDRAEIMNMWGAQRCLENKSTILGWLRESAYDNNYPYSEFVIGSLLSLFLKTYIKS